LKLAKSLSVLGIGDNMQCAVARCSLFEKISFGKPDWELDQARLGEFKPGNGLRL
jgi:hypothetical protein